MTTHGLAIHSTGAQVTDTADHHRKTAAWATQQCTTTMLIVAVVPHAKVAIPTQHALMGRIGYTPSVRS
ncbi:hypothetical protein EBZ35_06005, partial [bacterium]|nr:hypothetical protein [bacterium]